MLPTVGSSKSVAIAANERNRVCLSVCMESSTGTSFGNLTIPQTQPNSIQQMPVTSASTASYKLVQLESNEKEKFLTSLSEEVQQHSSALVKLLLSGKYVVLWARIFFYTCCVRGGGRGKLHAVMIK